MTIVSNAVGTRSALNRMNGSPYRAGLTMTALAQASSKIPTTVASGLQDQSRLLPSGNGASAMVAAKLTKMKRRKVMDPLVVCREQEHLAARHWTTTAPDARDSFSTIT